MAVLAKAAVGLVVAALFLWHDHVVAGTVVGAIVLTVGTISLVSLRGRLAVSALFGRLGRLLGRGLGIVVLVPVYLVGFTAARVWQRLAGSDPLQMKDEDPRSFWLQSDCPRRKRRSLHTMFATERSQPRSRRLLLAAAGLLMFILAAELIPRGMGFGRPLLYVNDSQAGFYPAPGQSVRRYGGRVTTNRFGMRSPDFSPQKPEDTLRILMIGDSTLFGGSYVDQEELYSRLLEGHLNRSASYGKVEVLNIGVNAWGPFHKLGYIRRHGTFDSDVAIVCMPIGDIRRPLYGLSTVPYFAVDRPPLCAIEEILGHLAWRYRSGIAGQRTDEAIREQEQLGIAAYVELAECLNRRGCEVVFEILPSRTMGTTDEKLPDEWRAAEDLRQALAAKGFSNFGYPVGYFQGLGTAEELYHDACHLHRKGHRLYADYLYGRMAQRSDRLANWSREILEAKRLEVSGEHIRR